MSIAMVERKLTRIGTCQPFSTKIGEKQYRANDAFAKSCKDQLLTLCLRKWNVAWKTLLWQQSSMIQRPSVVDLSEDETSL
jgi:hypothetical protein